MKNLTIRIEGSILSADILDKIVQTENYIGQKQSEFGFDRSVKDEIANAWADAQSLWGMYQRKVESLKSGQFGTTETRNIWISPLLSLLGYKAELKQKGDVIQGKNYSISHHDVSRDSFPIHIMGCNDSLDRKRSDSGPRMSPHSLVQEYINLTEHLYGIVTNGYQLRILRNSSRLIKLSFLEFDLERMMKENHYSDFALMFRLIHATRMPFNKESSSESIFETYHQESLESGSRIRDGLSKAVENSILHFANGFLAHPDNVELRDKVKDKLINSYEFYHYNLRLIYRLLFLMVIEERDLVFPRDGNIEKREIYYKYYSVGKLKSLAGKRYLADSKYKDYWIALKNTFKLFENEKYGLPLDIKPLAGNIFGSGVDKGIGLLENCSLDNRIIIQCLTDLSIFEHPDTKQIMPVNFGALNVEEFGSVYEGLLEYSPVIDTECTYPEFKFVKGTERSSSGTHYTPDELVQPLIKHSLEYVIEDKLKEALVEFKEGRLSGKYIGLLSEIEEKKLLSITVCDVACGSGHILLNAARRIATELAYVRTGEEQPSPKAFRIAIRDVIRHCIYGVDINPLAVELCKVALWLEAHNPNEPLNFLDHHIKCGNAIIGLAHKEELEKGIANEAFKTLSGDDKDICAKLRKRNKDELKQRTQGFLKFNPDKINSKLQTTLQNFTRVLALPEGSPEQIEFKTYEYKKLKDNLSLRELRQIADIQIAQFFIPKTDINHLITNETYFRMLNGELPLQGQAVAKAGATAFRQRFFHWFLEFPKIMSNGGFDCILGNPPYLGGSSISSNFGHDTLNYIKYYFNPAGGQADFVTYFLRRNHQILNLNRFLSLITTNSISDGDSRMFGFEEILRQKSEIIFANPSFKWPGEAKLFVSIFSLFKGRWTNKKILKNNEVNYISSFLDSNIVIGEPFKLNENINIAFKGVSFLGNGFVLTENERIELISNDIKNKDIIEPLLNGRELNDSPEQKHERYIINFFDWPEEKAKKYNFAYNRIFSLVKPVREKSNDRIVKEKWWLFERSRPNLYKAIKDKKYCIVLSKTAKYLLLVKYKKEAIFSSSIIVISIDETSLYTILQSIFHNMWIRKYSSKLKTDLSYSPEDGFQTFPFPQNLTLTQQEKLDKVGEKYYEFRKQLMMDIQLGLTKTYNQFHNQKLRILTDEELAEAETLKTKDFDKKYGKETRVFWNHLNKPDVDNKIEFNEAVKRIEELRLLHKQMDEAVLEAYGWDRTSPALLSDNPNETWPAIDLKHDFYEVDYLPENDRIRYTIHPDSRKEILMRLLLLNHHIHAQEEAASKRVATKKKASKKKVKKADAVSEIILPTEKRNVFESEDYSFQVIINMINQNNGINLDDLVTAYTLLCYPEIMKSNTQDNLRNIQTQWADQFRQKISKDSLLSLFKKMIANNWIKVRKNDDVAILSINHDGLISLPEDKWIQVDARLSVAVAKNISSLFRTSIPEVQQNIVEISENLVVA